MGGKSTGLAALFVVLMGVSAQAAETAASKLFSEVAAPIARSVPVPVSMLFLGTGMFLFAWFAIRRARQ